VLAPIAGVRSFLHDGSKDASLGAHLPLWTQTATPLLAERVAASAIVVAIAFSGAPSATVTPPRAGVGSASPQGLALGNRPVVIRPDAGAQLTKPDEKKSLVAQAGLLIEKVKKAADEPRSDDKKNDGAGDDGDDTIDPSDPNRASGQVVKTVTKTAEDTLPDH
jgi:hypothetical protein